MKTNKIYINAILLLLQLFIVGNTMVFSQEKTIDSLLKYEQYELFKQQSKTLINKQNDSSKYWFYQGKLFLKKQELDSALNIFLKVVDTNTFNKNYKSWFYYSLGDTYRYLNQEEKGYKFKLKAKQLFEEQGNRKQANQISYDLYYTLVSQEFLDINGESYLKEFFEEAKALNDAEQLLKAHLSLGYDTIALNEKEGKYHLEQAYKYAKQLGTNKALYTYYNYMWAVYINFYKDYNKALKYADSSYKYAKALKSPNRIESTLKNIAVAYRKKEDYKIAIHYLEKADTLPITENVYNRKRGLYFYLSSDYEALGLYEESLLNLKKKNAYNDSISIVAQNASLIENETLALKNKNLKISEENAMNKNLLIFALTVLILVIIIWVISLSNLRKKKLLIEKQKELKEERLEKLIKEQEVQNIDARYEGREKERQRIANDLHDDLGSILSTIMLYFQNLKVRKERLYEEENKLVEKTNELLEEAYKKVRNMAHLEDAASKISEGLVEAITNFAIKINLSENIIVTVQNNGLDIDLMQSQEQDLRRIIIELIRNAMRHGEADEINIEFLCTESNLNIVVEDNGIGFNPNDNDFKEGMGLSNINKKIEAMEGDIVVESVPKNGSTVIIDVPLL